MENQLTPEQQTVVDSHAKNILCCAGAGSGKTRVLINRILRLIRDGIKPSDICCITFTNEAARVIHDRLHPVTGEFAISLGHVGTLHSFALKHLQTYGGMANVTVLDDEEADEELLRCAKNAGCKVSEKALQAARANWLTEQHLPKDPCRIAVASYYRAMEATRALDFNSILTKAHEHLVDPNITGPLKRAWKHLFIDEAHDSSRVDMAIYAAIQTENRFVVCDPDQSIFSFRGGDVTCILELAEQKQLSSSAPEWELLRLEGNFRSSQAICDVAQKLIEHNTNRIPKRMVSLAGREAAPDSAHQTALKPRINLENKEVSVASRAFETGVSEAVTIAGTLSQLFERNEAEPNDVAILARTNAIAENIAETLEAHRIPVRRRVKPNLPEDWKKAKAAVRMLQARNDDAIIRFMRLESPSAIAHAERQHALGKMNLREEFMTGLECRDLKRLRISFASTERACLTADAIPDATLADVVLALSQDFEHETIGSGVFCSTVHQSKGKEFQIVIIVGCEENGFPLRNASIEEERRVMFVAMTRAKKTLRLTWAKARKESWGRREYAEREESRFIREALQHENEVESAKGR